MGSVHYLSPEQARGSIAPKQSDIYSLGIILYELLTGKVPFEGETAVSIALKHFKENIPSVRDFNRDIPQALENVVIKATAKDPSDRYKSAAAMAADLRTSLDPARKNEPRLEFNDDDDGETKVIELPSHHEKQPQQDEKKQPQKKQETVWHRYKKYIWSGIAIVALILAGSGGWWFFGRSVVTPDVDGQSTVKAEQTLHKHNLRVGNITRVYNSSIPKNHVVSSSPNGSDKTRVNSYVNLKVSQGVKQMTMADYVGSDYSDVASNLRAKGFRVEQVKIHSETVDPGQIMKQNYVKGKTVATASHTIRFKVSAGKTQIKIPDFKNQDVSVVQKFANEHHLQLTTQEKTSKTVATNHVIAQTPKAGSTLSRDDTLTVTVANSGNETKTTNIQINIPFDGNGGQRENRVQVYIKDAQHNITMQYQDITINQETTINVPFTLRQGEIGAYRVVRNGRTIMSATNITA